MADDPNVPNSEPADEAAGPPKATPGDADEKMKRLADQEADAGEQANAGTYPAE